MKKILVCGAGGFIGSHLVEKLKEKGHYVIGVDLKYPLYKETIADKFYQLDLRSQTNVASVLTSDIDEIYQLAADMGGAGYIFTGEHDADIMHNSATINLNILDEMRKKNIKKIFYSSSACMYPEHNQTDPDNPLLSEDSAYPANPDSEYGWEKLFSERLYLAYAKNHGIHVRIARFHNVFGPCGSWNNGKEKAPAALCRKVALSNDGDTIEIWGPGTQTRSFLYIDECLEGVDRLMNSDFTGPVNLGSERMISINNLVHLIAGLAGKKVYIKNVNGPMGVMGRNSDNRLIREKLNWSPVDNLEYGISQTYNWIITQIKQGRSDLK
jgi:nucleoside-diphosphate-sugar epimerase